MIILVSLFLEYQFSIHLFSFLFRNSYPVHGVPEESWNENGDMYSGITLIVYVRAHSLDNLWHGYFLFDRFQGKINEELSIFGKSWRFGVNSIFRSLIIFFYLIPILDASHKR